MFIACFASFKLNNNSSSSPGLRLNLSQSFLVISISSHHHSLNEMPRTQRDGSGNTSGYFLHIGKNKIIKQSVCAKLAPTQRLKTLNLNFFTVFTDVCRWGVLCTLKYQSLAQVLSFLEAFITLNLKNRKKEKIRKLFVRIEIYSTIRERQSVRMFNFHMIKWSVVGVKTQD